MWDHVGNDARERVGHLLREAWRRQRRTNFLRNPRPAAKELMAANEPYSGQVVKSAIALYNDGTQEERVVMIGASISEGYIRRQTIHRRAAPAVAI